MALFSLRKRNKFTYSPKKEKGAYDRGQQKNLPKNTRNDSLFQNWRANVDWPKWRINFVMAVFCLLWISLWGRAWFLQMVEGPRLADRAKRQHMASELVAGKRGLIYDRNGQVLARSVLVKSVYAKPQAIDDLDHAAAVLAPVLRMDAQKLSADLAGKNKKFVWLKRKVDDTTAQAVLNANLPGIGLSKEYERFYPFKHMAGQLIGFVGMDDKGLEGLERSLDSRLGAMPVRQMVQRDAMGRRFYLQDSGQGEPAGENITLTLDMAIQFIAEEAVARVAKETSARWSGAMVVDVDSGDILAWAQYPFFNPNLYRNISPQIYRNRLAADALEPGSTFKPLVMAAALQEKKVTPDTLINCEEGKWKSRNFTIRDTSIRGILPASKVLRYSSNIGMAKIGLSLGAQQFYRYLTALGFGEHSAVPVANSRGIVRKPRDWGEMDIMSAAFGQSVSVTALQMCQAYLTFLNHGAYKPLRLILEENNVEELPRRIFTERTVRQVMDMMRDVVEEKDGTGKRARIDGVQMGGKTGTAQKADPKTGVYGSKHLASFVGFLPANDPKYLILVLVDEPSSNQYGGVVAAPAFKEIASRVLTHTGVLNEAKVAKAPLSEAKKKRGLKLASAPAQPFALNSAKSAEPVHKASAPSGMNLPGHLARASSNVPDVMGKSVRNAVELFARAGVVPELKGTGNRVVRQSPPAGSPWAEPATNTSYILWLSEK